MDILEIENFSRDILYIRSEIIRKLAQEAITIHESVGAIMYYLEHQNLEQLKYVLIYI